MQDDDLAVVTQQVGHSQTGQRHDNQPAAYEHGPQHTAPGQVASNLAANNQAGMAQHPDELANPEPGQTPADADAIADANRAYASGNSPPNYDGLLTREAFHALQLRAQPFDGPTAGGELFADKQTYAQINEIRHALIGGDTLLLLSGEAGSGKTTLLKQLTSQGGQRLQFFSVRGSEQFTTENLFVGILDSWNLTPPATLEATVNELILSLQATRERDFIVVVMIDDAGNIPAKELHLLLASAQYINNGEDPLLRIILAAESDFEAQIPDLLPAGSNMPYSSLQLEPFHPSRAGPYIEFRLNQAGHYEVFPFDDRQVAAISNDAHGVPARINSLAADTLNAIHAPVPLKTRQTSLIPNFGRLGKIALGLLGLGLILAGLLYKAPEKTDPDKYSVVESAPVNPDVKKPTTDSNSGKPEATDSGSTDTASSTGTSSGSQNSTLQGNSAATSTPSVAASSTPSASPTSTAQTQSPASQPASEAVTETAGQAAGSLTTPPATPATGPASGEQVSTANEKAAATDVKAAAKEIEAALGGSAGATNPPAAEKPAEIKKPETAQVAADSSQTPEAGNEQNQASTGSTSASSASSEATQSIEQGNASTQAGTTEKPQAGIDSTEASASTKSADASSPAQSTAKADDKAGAATTETASSDTDKTDQTATTAAAKATGDKVEGIESANWILLQNPKQYTVQMSASTDQPSVVSFLRRSGLEAPNSIFSFQRSGKTWFALVHGLYPSIKDARAAIEKMSKSARSNQPWIREVGRIQKALKSSG